MKKDRHPDAHNFITLKTNTMKNRCKYTKEIIHTKRLEQKNQPR